MCQFRKSLTLKQPLKMSNEVDIEECYHHDPFLDFLIFNQKSLTMKCAKLVLKIFCMDDPC